MAYVQPATMTISSPDQLNRRVLFALEVFDPLAQSLVSGGLAVKAKGIDADPMVNRSGHFVWLDEGGPWPGEISVVPYRLPFYPATVTPPAPADPQNIQPAERLVRIVLRPTPAYTFPDGVTAIRGQLCESLLKGSPAVTDARVQLAWFDNNADQWAPPPELDVATDARGEFGVFVRVTPRGTQTPDIRTGLLKVRLQFSRGGATRATPDDFHFLAEPAAKGRIPEGQLLPRDLKLGWSDLPTI